MAKTSWKSTISPSLKPGGSSLSEIKDRTIITRPPASRGQPVCSHIPLRIPTSAQDKSWSAPNPTSEQLHLAVEDNPTL